MSNPFIFGPKAKPKASRYTSIGLSHNPFVPQDDDDTEGPLYLGHLEKGIADINSWLALSSNGNPPAISIKGSIGVGKTRLMKAIRNRILGAAQEEHVHAALIPLGSTGYARPSIGQLLLNVVDVFVPSWQDSGAHQLDSTPLVGYIIDSDRPISPDSQIGRSLTCVRNLPVAERAQAIQYVSRWLHRETLTPKQSEKVGLFGRLDYEGQLPDVLCDLLAVAKDAGILNKTYLMIDQLEDLFRHSYSELRQSRMVTDMRRLIDLQDAGAPLALVFAWSPDIDEISNSRDFVDYQMRESYGALYTRLIRNLVNVDKLRELHAQGFAEAYMTPLRDVPGNDIVKWPKSIELAGEAWTLLSQRGLIRDNTVTPRDLLTALAAVTERRAIEEDD